MTNLDDVSRIALALPETVQNGSSWSVGEKGFAWTYMQKVPDKKGRIERPDVLAVRTANLDEKDILVASEPEKFFTDAHYNGFPAVLVRLDAIESDELAELLTGAWRTCAPRKLRKEFEARQSAASEG